MQKSRGRRLMAGAGYGALVWLAYAQIEYVLCTLIPLRFPGFTLPFSLWEQVAVVFVSYALIGAILTGAVSALWLLLHNAGTDAPKTGYSDSLILANLTFLTVYLGWLGISGGWRESGLAPVAISLLLAAALWPGLRAGVPPRLRMMLACPWMAPVLLFGSYKLREYWDVKSAAAVWGISLAWAAAVAASALLLSRMRPMFALLADPNLFGRKAALFAGLCAAMFGASAAVNHRLPPAPVLHGAGVHRPNVLLVIWDTVRADHESLYGYSRDTTPFLRALSEHATLYRNAFSASDMTLSSTASLFTGLYASWHGSHFSVASPDGRPLDLKFQTIAEALRGQGYGTMAVLANCGYLGVGYRLNQGFQLYDVRTPVGPDAVDHRYYLRLLLQRIISPLVPVGEFDRRFRRADAVTGDVLTLVDAMRRQQAPFFVAANYMDAHAPYIPPPPYDSLYPGKDPMIGLNDLELLRKEVLQLKRSPTPHEMAHIQSQYDGGIAYMDAQMRRLVQGLRDRGLYDSTLIIFTADHGESLGERRMMEHAVSVYQNQVHVPLLVKYPGQSEGAVVTTPVSGIDIMPTILDVAGAAMPQHLQGRSLRKPETLRFILSESFRSGLLAAWSPTRFNRVERSIVQGSVKFIQSTAGKHELYDLVADPEERRNLFRTGDTAAGEMTRTLQEIIAAAPADSASSHQMDKQALERLRSLGYIQ